MILTLFKQSLLHITRSRLLIFIVIFAASVQYIGLKLIHFSTFALNKVVTIIGIREGLFAMIFLQIFNGTFLAAAYGIWMIPYLHQGPRSILTFALPVQRWKYPISYALAFLCLLFFQEAIATLAFGVTFGFNAFLHKTFPWTFWLNTFYIRVFAFETIAFAFAVSSLLMGQVPTFFLGMLTISLLQVAAVVYQVDWERYLPIKFESISWGKTIYDKLPPIGEIIFDIRQIYRQSTVDRSHLFLWAVWLAVFLTLFCLRLRFPSKSRTSAL